MIQFITHISTPQLAQVSVLDPEALCSFMALKEAFCTAPTLAHPNSEHPFIVEEQDINCLISVAG